MSSVEASGSLVPSPVIQIDYNIVSPTQLDLSKVEGPSQGRIQKPLSLSSNDNKAFYTSCSAALQQAQQELNSSITVWKDAIGDLERSKEVGSRQIGSSSAVKAGKNASGVNGTEDLMDDGGADDSSDDAEN